MPLCLCLEQRQTRRCFAAVLHGRQGADSSGRSCQSSLFPAVHVVMDVFSPALTRFLKLCRGGGTHIPTHPLEPEGTALSYEDAELSGVKRQALLALTEWSCGQWKMLLGFCLGFSAHQGLLALAGHSLAWVTCGLPQGLLVLWPNCLLSQAMAPALLSLLCCWRHSLMLLHLKGHCCHVNVPTVLAWAPGEPVLSPGAPCLPQPASTVQAHWWPLASSHAESR